MMSSDVGFGNLCLDSARPIIHSCTAHALCAPGPARPQPSAHPRLPACSKVEGAGRVRACQMPAPLYKYAATGTLPATGTVAGH